MTTKAPVKILALCGYTQNAFIFKGRLGAIRRACPDAEFVFVDPPHVVDMPTNSAADFDSSANASANSIEDTPRSWWTSRDNSDGSKTYLDLPVSLAFLRKTLDEASPPFDGVWGFSQGAAMAGILAALCERPSLDPTFESYSGGPLKWCVLSAGFLPVDPVVSKWFNPTSPFETPSLHVLGSADTIVGEERSVPFISRWKDARVEWHDGGHHTPSKSSWRKFFKAYLDANGDREVIAAIPSPSGNNSNAGTPLASGASTPTGTGGGVGNVWG